MLGGNVLRRYFGRSCFGAMFYWTGASVQAYRDVTSLLFCGEAKTAATATATAAATATEGY